MSPLPKSVTAHVSWGQPAMPAYRVTCSGILLLILACCSEGARLSDMKSSLSSYSSLSSISGSHGGIPVSRNVTKVAEVAKRITERAVQGFASTRKSPGKRASRGQCNQTCTYQSNISCRVTKRSTMCIHRDESATDFPNRPRELEIQPLTMGDKILFNITWKAPYDYSYKAVTGYELHVSRFDFYNSHPQAIDCYFVNLSTTDWSAVQNVHDVVYFLDCVQMWSSSFRKMHVTIFSYPKLANKPQEKSTDAWVYPDSGGVKPKNPAQNWDPNITVVQDMDNRSLIVNVQPAVSVIHFLKVCISRASSIPCMGEIFLMESPKNTFRYRVGSLEANQSYYVYIRPYDEEGKPLDVWIHKKNPIFLEPWPEEEPILPPEEHDQVTLGLVGALVIVLLLLLAIVITCVLWRRGCLQKIRLRFPQAAFVGRPIKVVQLYEKESEPFRFLVKAHMDYLSQYVNLEGRDCEALANQPNLDRWLEQSCTLLVYMSPQLMNELYLSDQNREVHYSPSRLLTRKVNLIHKMVSASAMRKGRKRRARIIFIMPGCWSSSRYMEDYLNQHDTLQRLPRFSISSPPGPLLSKLSGCHHSLLTTCGSSSARSQELSNTINTLLQNIRADQGQYPAGMHLNGHAHNQDMHGAYDRELDHNGHPFVMSSRGRVTGHPRRTDSGFSSSTDHHHGGSNPGSEHNNSPSDHYEEEGMETDPMIPHRLSFSASQVSLSFLPPESVAGDVDSVIMQEKCRTLNDQGDW